MSDWQEQLAGHRMHVDREFAARVRDSSLTNQEWNLVMTAVEFEVAGAGEDARLVAETSKVSTVVSHFDELGGQGAITGAEEATGSGGVLDSVKKSLGLGPGTGTKKLEEATDLADAYASELQAHLEDQGRWEGIKLAAASQSAGEESEDV